MKERSLDLMTTPEAAVELGCTVQHLRVLIKQGHLIGTKAGRDWFVDKESVSAYSRSRYILRKPEPLTAREQCALFSDLDLQPVVNVASVPQRSPFRYPGGKTWLIPTVRLWLNNLKLRAGTLVEPFAGGGGIALTAVFEGFVSRSHLVELDSDISAVWRVMLSDKAGELAEMVRAFRCTPSAVTGLLAKMPADDLAHAFQTIVRNRVSRGGILAPGAGLVKNGEAGRGLSSRWYPDTLADRIQAISRRRDRITFWEGDGFETLAQLKDDRQCAFFIDPPYPLAGRRLYRHYALDHSKLFELMNTLRGPFLATYDDNAEIAEMALKFGFETRLVPMKSTHHERKLELLVSRDLGWLGNQQTQVRNGAPSTELPLSASL